MKGASDKALATLPGGRESEEAENKRREQGQEARRERSPSRLSVEQGLSEAQDPLSQGHDDQHDHQQNDPEEGRGAPKVESGTKGHGRSQYEKA